MFSSNAYVWMMMRHAKFRHSHILKSSFIITHHTFKQSTWACDPAELLSYRPPDWATHLKNSPSVRVKLLQPFTPIHKWKLPGVPNDVEISIKRDDMTGSALSGNKIRKLEFLLADALAQNCQAVITCGGVQSNHCRTTAVAAKQLGMDAHLLLRSGSKITTDTGCYGNMLLNRLVGASMYLVPIKAQQNTELIPRMQILAHRLWKLKGIKAYTIPIGGSSVVGLHGYLDGWQELIEQGILDRFDDIVVVAGSGGTAAGIAIGNYLTGSKLRVHAFPVCDSSAYFHQHINETLEQVGLGYSVQSEQIIHIHDGAQGLGYGLSKPDELEFIQIVAQRSSILLDPTYMAKGALALSRELAQNRSKFKGSRILFLHSGGIFGMYSGRLNDVMMEAGGPSSVQNWMDLKDEPILDN